MNTPQSKAKKGYKKQKSDVLQYLRMIDKVVNTRPKKSPLKIRFEIEAVNELWQQHCTKYQRENKGGYIDTEMFNKSIKLTFEKNNIWSTEDFNVIFDVQ